MSATIALTGKHRTFLAKTGQTCIISECDYDRVTEHEWHISNTYDAGYPNNNPLGSLHRFIMGERPSNIPEDYVIDHANRNVLDAQRCNLRWTSRSWNTFNTALRKKTTSRFKGVFWIRKSKKWGVYFRRISLGTFLDEREAAKAYARKAVEYWPEWAPSSDLLMGPELLTQEEMTMIVHEVENRDSNTEMQRVLPVGVSVKNKGFRAMYCSKSLGVYSTPQEAGRVYQEYKNRIRADKWAAHTKTHIVRDDEGDAVIALSGEAAKGQFTKVPDRFWHRLTFNSKWNLRGPYAAGQLDGTDNYLHIIVYRLCHPDEPIIGTIDHIDPAAKLNNLETNLRDATQDMQARNKQKKQNCSSNHIGIYQNKKGKWIGRVSHKGTRYWTKWVDKEEEAVVALKALKDSLSLNSDSV